MNTVFEQIRGEVEGHDVVLFMKGSPVFPQCGFSAAVVQILSHLGVKFKGIDVLQDPRRRLRHRARDGRDRRAGAALHRERRRQPDRGVNARRIR
jgi:glutaredoxin-related protein